MSKKALEMLKTLFSAQSPLQLPVGTAEQVIEIRAWVEEQLKKVGTSDKKI